MGIYVYKRTSEVIRATDEDGQEHLINVYRYATKPYWELWYDATSDVKPFYRTATDRRIVASYARLQNAAERRMDKMRENGTLSQLVVILDREKLSQVQKIQLHYDESTPRGLTYDSDWRFQERGYLVRHGRRWKIVQEKHDFKVDRVLVGAGM